MMKKLVVSAPVTCPSPSATKRPIRAVNLVEVQLRRRRWLCARKRDRKREGMEASPAGEGGWRGSGRRAIDGAVEGGGVAQTVAGRQLLRAVRLELRGSAEKKGGGRIRAPPMEKGGSVVRGCSLEERGLRSHLSGWSGGEGIWSAVAAIDVSIVGAALGRR
jgi:hypothetical protein